jgi:hypothetical protein
VFGDGDVRTSLCNYRWWRDLHCNLNSDFMLILRDGISGWAILVLTVDGLFINGFFNIVRGRAFYNEFGFFQ